MYAYIINYDFYCKIVIFLKQDVGLNSLDTIVLKDICSYELYSEHQSEKRKPNDSKIIQLIFVGYS